MTVFTLSETNAWNAEPHLLGVFTTRNNAIEAARTDSKETLTSDDVRGLEFDNQTQGRDVNYDLREIELDKLF